MASSPPDPASASPLPQISTGTTASYVFALTHLCARAFHDNPITRRFIAEGDGLAPADEGRVSEERRRRHFRGLVEDGVTKGGVVVEAGGWAGAALWIPVHSTTPEKSSTLEADGDQAEQGQGEEVKGSGKSVLGACRQEYISKLAAAKARYLGEPARFHWYLAVLMRDENKPGKGVVRALLTELFDRADNAKWDGLVWLDTTSARARDIYEHFGFRVVEAVRVWEGVADADGAAKEGGEGVLVWLMMRKYEGVIGDDGNLYGF